MDSEEIEPMGREREWSKHKNMKRSTSQRNSNVLRKAGGGKIMGASSTPMIAMEERRFIESDLCA